MKYGLGCGGVLCEAWSGVTMKVCCEAWSGVSVEVCYVKHGLRCAM